MYLDPNTPSGGSIMKMQTFRKPHQWINFWLEKYADVLTDLKYSGEKRKKYWAVLKEFLEKLPGNPRNLSINAVRNFIIVDPENRLHPIVLFYHHIAPSKPHTAMLENFDPSDPASPDNCTNGPVEKFEALLLKQNLTEKTVKNYCTALSGYLKWMDENGIDVLTEKIDEYCNFITTIKQLAPRTVSIHRSALTVFYTNLIMDGTATSDT